MYVTLFTYVCSLGEKLADIRHFKGPVIEKLKASVGKLLDGQRYVDDLFLVFRCSLSCLSRLFSTVS